MIVVELMCPEGENLLESGDRELDCDAIDLSHLTVTNPGFTGGSSRRFLTASGKWGLRSEKLTISNRGPPAKKRRASARTSVAATHPTNAAPTDRPATSMTPHSNVPFFATGSLRYREALAEISIAGLVDEQGWHRCSSFGPCTQGLDSGRERVNEDVKVALRCTAQTCVDDQIKARLLDDPPGFGTVYPDKC